uniref:Uncharacterized protein n=2 Tax=Oryza sativa subsp. japonica TaxID=39947 RepID=Q6AVU1_ORYSJ|nr:hypothetical protein [Oryza sativa Japonica Group]AAT78783.1 hypothetical protein [Oryza sativa Japonica Group]ABF98718.1 hypothetical protein LOC_Os03g52330 [Oryza sativa Japonica Group]
MAGVLKLLLVLVLLVSSSDGSDASRHLKGDAIERSGAAAGEAVMMRAVMIHVIKGMELEMQTCHYTGQITVQDSRKTCDLEMPRINITALCICSIAWGKTPAG